MTLIRRTAPAAAARDSRRRRWSLANIVVGLLITTGSALVAYPSIASWASDISHASAVSGYAQAVSDTDSTTLSELLDRAQEYNALLPDGPLRDPYLLNPRGGAVSVEEGRHDYVSQLAVVPGGPMARVRIPAIDVDLPVYHGTDEKTLAIGIGHLYGSSLPVGGSGTHAVLTGHSGLPDATLFSHLDEVVIGDLFHVDVAGEVLTYRVDQIETVLPDDGEDLRRVPGRDYVTLLTCTPTGVNTHRLLVRGERVTGSTSHADQIVVPASTEAPRIPWGAMALLIGTLTVSVLIAWPRRSPDRP